MGLIDKVQVSSNRQTSIATLRNPNSGSIISEKGVSLSHNETQFLLSVLGETSIKVKDIEAVYNLVVKLQNHYLALTNTE